MKVLIFGGTGLVGAECVRQAIADKDIERVTAITRRPLPADIVSDKLDVITHKDFLEYNSLLDTFRNHQACIWALGISQAAVNETQYVTITHDYTLAAAKAMSQVNPDLRFIFVSGMGADSTERSRMLFGRVKGKTENDLLNESGLKHVHNTRPGGIFASTSHPDRNWREKMMLPLLYTMGFFKPSMTITTLALSRALLYLAKNGHETTLFDNQALRNLVVEKHLVE